jgi:hypothetical protein
MPRLKSSKNLKLVSFKIEEEDYALARRVAAKQNRSAGNYFRLIIDEALKPHRPKKVPPPPPEKNPDHEALDELLDIL